jgi:hypothetical protein
MLKHKIYESTPLNIYGFCYAHFFRFVSKGEKYSIIFHPRAPWQEYIKMDAINARFTDEIHEYTINPS